MDDSSKTDIPVLKDFNFDYWSRLAVEDPERFERERMETIEKIMSDASEHGKERLRRLQWRIDMERAQASNPLSSCIKAGRMMWESFYSENGFFNAVNSWAGVDVHAIAGTPQKKTAAVTQLFSKRIPK